MHAEGFSIKLHQQTSKMALTARAISVITDLAEATKNMPPTMTAQIKAIYGPDPYLVLISCLLSLRTRDAVSFAASKALFEHAKTPQELLALPTKTIETLIYPVGFYHRKALVLKHVSQELITRFGGHVPQTEQELLSIKGIGRKTANLVLSEAFGLPGLCVDTHVHRIANKLGLVQTKTPEQTERALKELLPPEYWALCSRVMVVWGQNTPRNKNG